MQLLKALEKLEKLLKKWGLTENDWFLTGEYAWKLQGYNMIFRKGHLDVFVNRRKWPWKTKSEDISCFPPPKTKEFIQLKKFIKETGFAPHFLPCPIKFKYHLIKELRKKSDIYILPNKRKIKIYRILEDFKERKDTLLKEDLSTWKRETVERWLKYFSKIKKLAEIKNDKKMIKVCKEALEKLKDVRKICQPRKKTRLSKLSLINYSMIKMLSQTSILSLLKWNFGMISRKSKILLLKFMRTRRLSVCN